MPKHKITRLVVIFIFIFSLISFFSNDDKASANVVEEPAIEEAVVEEAVVEEAVVEEAVIEEAVIEEAVVEEAVVEEAVVEEVVVEEVVVEEAMVEEVVVEEAVVEEVVVEEAVVEEAVVEEAVVEEAVVEEAVVEEAVVEEAATEEAATEEAATEEAVVEEVLSIEEQWLKMHIELGISGEATEESVYEDLKESLKSAVLNESKYISDFKVQAEQSGFANKAEMQAELDKLQDVLLKFSEEFKANSNIIDNMTKLEFMKKTKAFLITNYPQYIAGIDDVHIKLWSGYSLRNMFNNVISVVFTKAQTLSGIDKSEALLITKTFKEELSNLPVATLTQLSSSSSPVIVNKSDEVNSSALAVEENIQVIQKELTEADYQKLLGRMKQDLINQGYVMPIAHAYPSTDNLHSSAPTLSGTAVKSLAFAIEHDKTLLDTKINFDLENDKKVIENDFIEMQRKCITKKSQADCLKWNYFIFQLALVSSYNELSIIANQAYNYSK